ncbi:hypothetical protein Pmar_PMAR006105 [Perkinsus marinus ATCC 50983]|uniref:Uncharacterized protein n=1 Tax=Perkinsus marinus (strain ATCC 50983 / TXsc) TaxID=423536 RepID=C5LA82_PERM5|nr:hypothetical protein Pmar_PMAR006105 [Perkinsus marinus ATCC 50983]EER06338.1 hypothetical protein Pmar_PMAR006105 [Perkinsus marinus ATCC 50983]|eukprot:XP_002774522.1 hypothetical protein Pmar_PMAR006105 [Perkinsus marinus ATCC 50983]
MTYCDAGIQVDFSKSNPEFSVDTSLVNHVSRPTVSRVWSSAATAEAAKDEELPDPTWNIRLGVYRGDFEASPERDDEGDNKPGRRDNDSNCRRQVIEITRRSVQQVVER